MEPYPQPPPYHEQDAARPQTDRADLRPQRIARKPVPGNSSLEKGPSVPLESVTQTPALSREAQIAQDEELARQLQRVDIEDEAAPPLPLRPAAVERSMPPRIMDSTIYASPDRIDSGATGTSVATSSTALASTSTGLTSPPPTQSKGSQFMQKAYGEAMHFAGGLIEHPAESNKHFSILRHSNGLVFYQGTKTSIAISIFADAPLPGNRTLWLQNKGWSGNTGMKVKSLVGHNDHWINVTPQTRVTASNLKPSDERAWQRDIGKFLKHADKKIRDKQRLRETCIVRIPVEAEDGYFRIVLCAGGSKKVLCPSPVIRILSTSTSPSSIRGASLSTLPLEIGAKIGAIAANTYASNAISPVKTTLQNTVQPYMPSWAEQQAASLTYDMTASSRVDSTLSDASSRFDQQRELSYTPVAGEEPVPDLGPQPPYPLSFSGRVEAGSASGSGSGMGSSEAAFGMPTANLAGVPEQVTLRLRGYYFGWARIRPSKKHEPSQPYSRSQSSSSLSSPTAPAPAPATPTTIVAASRPPEQPDHHLQHNNPWYEAVISALPPSASQVARAHVAIGAKAKIAVHLIHDFEDASLVGATLDIKVMGFIRPPNSSNSSSSAPPPLPPPPPPRTGSGPEKAGTDVEVDVAVTTNPNAAWEAAMLAAVNDVAVAEACLARPAWGPDENAKRTSSGLESVSSGVASARLYAQRQIDRMPLHRAGVRMPVDEMRDRAVGAGGIYIVR